MIWIWYEIHIVSRLGSGIEFGIGTGIDYGMET